jgi:hypothetical protein
MEEEPIRETVVHAAAAALGNTGSHKASFNKSFQKYCRQKVHAIGVIAIPKE